MLDVFTCDFLPMQTRLGSHWSLLLISFSNVLFLLRTFLESELSSGSFPQEQLCAALELSSMSHSHSSALTQPLLP